MKTMDISASLLGFKTGFTLDYGSTLVKFIYVSDIGNDKVRLHFVCYQQEDFEAGLDCIKEQIGSSLTPGQEVVMTGIGVTPYTKLLEKKFNIRVRHQVESTLYGLGLLFLLKNFPLNEIVEPLSSHVKEHALRTGKLWMKGLENIATACPELVVPDCLYNMDNVNLEPGPTEKVSYPFLMMMAGSCLVPILVQENGTTNFLDVNPIGGRTLLGLSSILANIKSFEEISEAASKGNAKAMNQHFDSAVGESEQNEYDVMKMDLNLFSMGQAVGKQLEDFSQADRAAGIVSMISTSIAMYSFTWAKALRAEHIFIIGGIAASSNLIKDEIAKVFLWQSLSDQMDFHPKLLFVKHGEYMAALGALLANRPK